MKMRDKTPMESAPDAEEVSQAGAQRGSEVAHLQRTRRRRRLIEAIVLPVAWVAVFIAFGLAEPQTYPTVSNVATMLASQAVLVVVTLGLLLPLTAGDYDLSMGSVVGLSAMVIALLNVEAHWPVGYAVLAALGLGLVVGALNAFFTMVVGVQSLIVTLGSATLVQGITLWISSSQTVSGVSYDLVNPTIIDRLFGVPLEFYYALALCLVIWYLFERTPVGRRLLIVGRGPVVARLSGISVGRVRAGALIASGFIAAFAGVLYAGTSGSAAPTGGQEFLLPAFAAAFLGATTVKPGVFNPVGSTIAVYFLVFGVTGLEFLGAPTYVQDVFYGTALILAVTFSQLVRRSEGSARS
jgi:ribose transport system permease protein